ncbi:Ribosomal protein arginine N-methyltransferase rmt3 [Pleurostoma richardsiae]|uniref:type I protein arginine methyltransferase n=1 Tax=Pleurostoma richardsiae TaxID=41990 RepID=A0AA38RRP8_9PEZI|nr:Ribosomal protein arginine N-methyltransferase rmt3 [Pleurostoma richardsiae]
MAPPRQPSDVHSDLSSETSDDASWDDDVIDEEQDDDEEALTFVSLLDDRVFSDAQSMLSYCKEKFNLDFLTIRDRLGLDFYGTIKLINFIRHQVHEGISLPEQITLADIQDDKYLKPVIDDDALILALDDLPDPAGEAADAGGQVGDDSAAAAGAPAEGDLRKKNAELQAELESLSRQFANYRLAVQQTLDKRWGVDEEGQEQQPGSSRGQGGKTDPPAEEVKDESAYYWESYAHNDIHETMLKDTVRTDAYRDFIYGNKHLFAGKVVLDIGCGTGILSMFCAKAGAKQVIAVDKSAIIDKARENIFNNGLDGTITCLRGRIEDVVLPVDKVDVIVSEWMGYCLLYEAMLPSVIWARDRYLRAGGILAPSHATICVAPAADPEYVADTVTFWRDVYGFDMKAMLEGIYTEARVQTMPEAAVCGTATNIPLDLYTVRAEDLIFRRPWSSTATADADALDGFLVWFDIFFDSSREARKEPLETDMKDWTRRGGDIFFTTGPYGKETHWKQGLLLNKHTEETSALKKGDALAGEISYSVPEDHARGLVMKMSWEAPGGSKKSQTWLIR